MNFRRAVLILGSLLLLALAPCSRLTAAPASDPLARVHWLGLDNISADTNAADVMAVWNLPQTTALVAQTLDKISRLPGHGTTNPASARLRPLLDDLISSEFYLEIVGDAATNRSLSAGGDGRGEVGLNSPAPAVSTNPPSALRPPPFLLALRLSAARAQLWRTNLPAVLNPVTFSKTGDWTLIGVGQGTGEMLPAFAARFPSPLWGEGGQRPGEVPPPGEVGLSNPSSHLPTPISQQAAISHASHPWLEADLAPSRLADLFPLSARPTVETGRGEVGSFNPISHLLSPISHVHLMASGDSGHVLTHATLDFSHPFAAPLPAWEIPTNLISQPLSGFTAVRGLSGWLAALPAWQDLRLVPAPDQAFFWAQPGAPFQSYFAAPLPGAGGQLAQLAARLVQNANPWLATNGEGNFQWQTNPPGLVWHDALILSPTFKPVIVNQHDYVLGGLVPLSADNPNPPPPEFLRPILTRPGLVYYQVELTGDRIRDGLFVSQLLRLVFHKSQLPPSVTVWLNQAEPLLGNSTTMVVQTAPAQLVFTRKSTLGFTALELDLLSDWLESPQFPRGLHTFLAPPNHQ